MTKLDGAELKRLRGLCGPPPGPVVVRDGWKMLESTRAGLAAALDEIERLREILGNVEFYLRKSGLAKQCAPALMEQFEPFRVP